MPIRLRTLASCLLLLWGEHAHAVDEPTSQPALVVPPPATPTSMPTSMPTSAPASPPDATPAAAPSPAVEVPTSQPTQIMPRVLVDLSARIRLTGFVQVDAIPWNQASLDELDPSTRASINQTRFHIPRARVRAEGEVVDEIDAAVELDANSQNGLRARLLAAELAWRHPRRAPTPLVELKAGLIKIPFGVEVPGSERQKPFLDLPLVSQALFPGNYDLGAAASGGYGFLRWSGAIMNGAPVADRQWTGEDPSASYDFVGRVGIDVPGPARTQLALGLSGLSGTGLHPGVEPTKSELQWIDEDQDGQVDSTELQVLPGTPGEPSTTFDRSALGVDLSVAWHLGLLGAGRLSGEAAMATNLDRGLVYADPVAASRDLRALGLVLGATQSLTRHATVGVRYEHYDADRDATEQAGVDLVGVDRVFSTWSVMASGHRGSARLLVQYDRVRNPFGRDDGGRPSTRSADRVTIRAQAEF